MSQELVARYIELQKQKEVVEEEQRQIKVSLAEQLDKATKVHDFGIAQAEWVNGRTSTKVDEKKVRMELALHDVDLKVITEAFAKGTSVTIGEPSLRITAK
jgi:hypothetical protein